MPIRPYGTLTPRFLICLLTIIYNGKTLVGWSSSVVERRSAKPCCVGSNPISDFTEWHREERSRGGVGVGEGLTHNPPGLMAHSPTPPRRKKAVLSAAFSLLIQKSKIFKLIIAVV